MAGRSKFTTVMVPAAIVALALAGRTEAMTVLGVYDTGVDAAGHALPSGNDVTDLHYTIVGGTSVYAVPGQQAKTFNEFDWFAPDTAGSRAINATGGATADDDATIVISTTFDLTGYSLASAVLSGTAQADDAATIELNGHLLTTPPIGYYSATSFATANATFFVSGVNILDFIVHNATGHTALRVNDLTVSADRLVDAVPEPQTWALLVGGFGLIGAVSRRRRSAVPQRVNASTSARTFA